jgi:hypothetical protein
LTETLRSANALSIKDETTAQANAFEQRIPEEVLKLEEKNQAEPREDST